MVTGFTVPFELHQGFLALPGTFISPPPPPPLPLPGFPWWWCTPLWHCAEAHAKTLCGLVLWYTMLGVTEPQKIVSCLQPCSAPGVNTLWLNNLHDYQRSLLIQAACPKSSTFGQILVLVFAMRRLASEGQSVRFCPHQNDGLCTGLGNSRKFFQMSFRHFQ